MRTLIKTINQRVAKLKYDKSTEKKINVLLLLVPGQQEGTETGSYLKSTEDTIPQPRKYNTIR